MIRNDQWYGWSIQEFHQQSLIKQCECERIKKMYHLSERTMT